ncbi:MAG: hypothetical protein Kow0062_11840 [Acidobacteriota bacterium]|nr:MAG: spore maturation protein [Acidobacteriota bacterium]
MEAVLLVLVLAAAAVGLATGRVEAMGTETLEAARGAVRIALELIGVMALFLGLVEVLKQAGLLGSLARALRPVFRRLFPDVPDGHPALAAMTLNIGANMLGLANAATPFGIKAMEQLDRLNGRKGTATDAMCLFLAINTSSVALLPTGTIGLRVALDSADPVGILFPTWIATSLSTLTAITAALLLARLGPFRRSRPPVVVAPAAGAADETAGTPDVPQAPPWRPGRAAVAAVLVVVLGILAVRWALGAAGDAAGESGALERLSSLVLLAVIVLPLVYGWSRGVRVYEALVEGAREGFQVAVRIIPYLVAILAAVALFRGSGAMELLARGLSPLTDAVGFPAEALPMALVRPLSGSGAMGLMVETMKTHGPDSFIGYLVSTLMGSTETTFYVLAVYGGAVGLRRARHAVPACLAGDLAGVIGATLACHLLLS